ncbi:putative lipoprotein [Myxococcus stipitatus DSM 14675]|uniref:Putative lipoprotein n=1 Tax=Myxococcus stipitatus (strain DSM 14675 / JCM 12634 / Mx s8) TaxID=1278073 RepID=L7UEH8_MYXSD|nr:fused MFS/spermidine synthase [Myxococcus stipitatus]AGC47326.1 putative lipoprotein [Myxococcus stipitatus DSM 14675]
MVRFIPWLALLVSAFLSCGASGPRKSLYEKQSPYTLIAVTEDPRGRRYLQFDTSGALQSVVWPGQPLKLPYTRMSMVGLSFVPKPQRILVVGLGGGAMPMFLRAVLPRAHIDVVDIDPDVVSVARRYFGFREDARLKAHVADGRAFIEAERPVYDLVFLDAYGPDSIPEHLGTVEFLASVRARLTARGAVVGNVWEDPPNPLFSSMLRTWRQGFQQLYTFAVPGSGNRIFVGVPYPELQSREVLESRAQTLETRRRVPFDLSAMVAEGYDIVSASEDLAGAVLKDPPREPAPGPVSPAP